MPIKIRILRFVADQGVVTVWDVMDYFGQWKNSNTVRITMFHLGITQMRYGGIQHGIWFIRDKELFERLRVYYPDIPRYKVRGENLLARIPHSLGMNELRTILEKTDRINITEWWSEEYIRALPVYRKDGLSGQKVPDAIFWRRRNDGTKQKFYFEYERSMKSPQRYGRILQFYAKRRDVENHNVIYICETEQIRDKLIKVEQDLFKWGRLIATDQYFVFVLKDDFMKSYAGNN